MDEPDAAHTQRDAADLDQRLARRGALVQPGNEVGYRDVDHARRGEGEDLGDPALDQREREEREHAAGEGRHPRDDVPEERPRLAEAGVQQHEEVADLLRDLVGDDRERGHHAELHVGEEGTRDDHAVGEVVERVAEDDHPAGAPVVVA